MPGSSRSAGGSIRVFERVMTSMIKCWIQAYFGISLLVLLKEELPILSKPHCDGKVEGNCWEMDLQRESSGRGGLTSGQTGLQVCKEA